VSLAIDLAVLAEGVATDARGNLTLVAANTNLLVADELPVQFSPIFVVAVVDDDESQDPPVLTTGAIVSAKVEAMGPDSEVLFVAQLRQVVQPPPYPSLNPRMQLVAQVPFTASKIGVYKVSAVITISDGIHPEAQVTATRKVRITDFASLKAKPD
jgi:hypothetical protein